MPLSDYDQIITDAADEWNLDPKFLRAILMQENAKGDRYAISRSGALGIGQLMPATARAIGVTDPFDPVQSIYGAAKYLDAGLSTEGSPERAALYYHGGPGWRSNFGPESAAYVPGVVKNYRLASAGGSFPVPKSATTDDDILKLLPPAPAPSTPPSETPAPSAPVPATGAAKPGAAATDDDILKLLPPAPTSAPTTAPLAATSPQSVTDPIALDPYLTGTTPPAAAPPPSGPRGGIPANVGAGELETLNALAADPIGSMLLHPLAVAGGTAYDALARGTGWFPPMSDALRREIYGQGPIEAAMPKPGESLLADIAGGPINLLGDVFGAHPSDITATTPPEQYSRAVGAALPGAALVPGSPLVTMPALAGGAIAGKALSDISPEWLKPGAEMVGNVLTTGGLLGARAGMRPLLERDVTAGPARPAGDSGAPLPTGELLPPEGGGGAQPAGAMVTPPAAAARTAREISFGNTVADEEWLNTPQQPGVRDTRVLVEGNTPTLTEQEQAVETARELKRLRNEYPEVSQDERQLLHDASENRKTAFKEAVPSDLTLNAAEDAAGKRIESDLQGVWANKGPADPAPVAAQITKELSGSAGDLPPLKSAMKQVQDSLENAGTDPQAMYRTHRLINFLQSKQGKLANPGYGADDVQAALTRVKGMLAQQIDASAPGFAQAMKTYSDSIGPIRAAQDLNGRYSGLFDSRGYMNFNRFHELMKDVIHAGHPDAPTNDLRGISDFQLQRLKDIHDDLKRSASAQDLAKAYGSDTTQNVMDIIKGVGQTAGSLAIRAAAGYALGPYGPFAVDAAGRIIGARRAAAARAAGVARGQEILRPQNLPPPNPPQP